MWQLLIWGKVCVHIYGLCYDVKENWCKAAMLKGLIYYLSTHKNTIEQDDRGGGGREHDGDFDPRLAGGLGGVGVILFLTITCIIVIVPIVWYVKRWRNGECT